MTTHDEQTLTDSYDESQTEVAETPPVDEQRTPEVSGPADAGTERAAIGRGGGTGPVVGRTGGVLDRSRKR